MSSGLEIARLIPFKKLKKDGYKKTHNKSRFLRIRVKTMNFGNYNNMDFEIARSVVTDHLRLSFCYFLF